MAAEDAFEGDGVADVPRRLRAEETVQHYADAFAKHLVEAAFLRLVVHHDEMKRDRRPVVAELVLGSELARVVRVI